MGHGEAASGQIGLLTVRRLLDDATAAGNAQLRSLNPLVGERLGRSGGFALAPQAGADVSGGANAVAGMIDSGGLELIDGDLKAAGLCAVNVHWHEGAEHRSAGQYDEGGTGPGLGYEPDRDVMETYRVA